MADKSSQQIYIFLDQIYYNSVGSFMLKCLINITMLLMALRLPPGS